MKKKKFPGTKTPRPEIEFPSVTEINVPDPPVPNRAHTEMRLDPPSVEFGKFGVFPSEFGIEKPL